MSDPVSLPPRASACDAHEEVPRPPGTVSCPQCGQRGWSDRRFCGRCGAGLWQSCPQCGVEMPAADRFCTACGVEVRHALTEREQDYYERIAAARNLAENHQYADALKLLQGLIDNLQDSRLHHVRQLAVEASSDLQARQAAMQRAAERALCQARELRSAGRWVEARQQLARIPQPLRGEAITALDRELASLIDREQHLRARIAAAIADKQLTELAMLVEQLHALRPEDEQARSLGRQLRQQMLPLARQHLAACRDRLALRAVQSIPPSFTDDEVRGVLEEAQERVALREAIAEAAYATAHVANLLRRLARQVACEPQISKWWTELAQRMSQKPADPRWPGPTWKAAQGVGRLGMSVEAWAYLSGPQVPDAETRSTLQEHPGQFFTAWGLALEALGLTSWSCELSPPREGLLARLAGLGRRTAKAVWALDVGATAVKALRVTREGETVRIEKALHLPVTGQGAEPLGACEEPLRRLAEHVIQAPALVCVGVPGRWILGRFFEMPLLKGRQWEQALRYEVQHQMPLPLDELCWQAMVVGELETSQPAARRLVLQAVRRTQIEQLLATCRAAGLEVARLQSEPLALHHAVQWELAGSQAACGEARSPQSGDARDACDPPAEAVLLVDLGASQTQVVYSSRQSLFFRILPVGTDEWARRLCAVFACSQLPAGRALLFDPAAAPVFCRWQEAIRGMLEGLAGQIERCVQSFPKLGGAPPRRLIGVGGGFQVPVVVSFLQGRREEG